MSGGAFMPGKSAKASSNSGFMKPMQPDQALSAVIGSQPVPRTEVTKKIWEYVRKHNLQDPNDKRTIRADDKLKPVFDGRSSVSMFEMTKLVNGHLKEAK
jgi:upstream activation factor subunit UAF30